MKEYKVYFEIFGKKMQTTLDAESIEDAKLELFDKIIFHKVVSVDGKPDESTSNKNLFGDMDAFNNIMNIFGMKK